MFITSFSIFWNLHYFLFTLYLFFIISTTIYLLTLIKEISFNSILSKNSHFFFYTNADLFLVLMSFLLIFLTVLYSWVMPGVVIWFGNLIFTSFQIKISYLVIFFFILIILILSTSTYTTSKAGTDFILILLNFFYWIFFLFLVNNLLIFIFFIEILSTLVFLLVIGATFSSTYFYNNLNLNTHLYFQNSTPFFFIQILIFFFWISLISSLNLFFFLTLFYLKFFSFDWNLFEYLFFYIIIDVTFKDFIFIFFIWFNLLFCFFFKCGVVPFYFWKPTFFKGLSIYALFFYVTFYYYFLLLFLIIFLLNYVNEVFFFFNKINILILFLGFFFCLTILCEAFYLKAFLALSSILNTLFIFLTLLSNNTTFLVFFL